MTVDQVSNRTAETLRELIENAGGRYRVLILALSERHSRKDPFINDGRPFFSLTEGNLAAAVREAFATELKEALRRKDGSLAKTMQATARAIQLHVQKRFQEQGADITLTQLSLRWTQYKARNRLDPRIGMASGALVRAVFVNTIWAIEKETD